MYIHFKNAHEQHIFYPHIKHLHKLRWKHIYWIKSLMHIKNNNNNKSWLCGMGRHNWTNQQTVLIAQDLKCCFGHSEIPESKSVIKVIWYNYLQNCLHNCVPKQASASESKITCPCFFSSAHSKAQIIYYIWKKTHSDDFWCSKLPLS